MLTIKVKLRNISTHAPRTGSDGGDQYATVSYVDISTHAPRTGSDNAFKPSGFSENISTHAPRTGSDFTPCCEMHPAT